MRKKERADFSTSKIHRIVQEPYLRMLFSEFLFLVNLVNSVEIIRQPLRDEKSF